MKVNPDLKNYMRADFRNSNDRLGRIRITSIQIAKIIRLMGD